MNKKSLLKKITTHLKKAICVIKGTPSNIKEFGFFATELILRRACCLIKAEEYMDKMSVCTKREIENILEKYNKGEKYNKKQKVDFNGKFPVWVCWLQGEEKMPELCRACVNNIKAILPENAQLVFITYENMGEYLDIPEEVLNKHFAGKISPVNFSDVVRYGLLANYGGAWIDTAIYLTQNVIEKAFEHQVYTPRFYKSDTKLNDASRGRWVGGCWFTQEGNSLFSFVYDSLVHFWQKHDKALEYLFCDYIIWNGYLHNQEIKDILDGVPENNFSLRILNDHLNDEYTPELFEKIANENEIHLINRHKEYLKKTADGKKTIYGYILEQYKESEIDNEI